MDLFNFQTCKIDEFHPVHGRLCVTLVKTKMIAILWILGITCLKLGFCRCMSCCRRHQKNPRKKRWVKRPNSARDTFWTSKRWKYELSWERKRDFFLFLTEVNGDISLSCVNDVARSCKNVMDLRSTYTNTALFYVYKYGPVVKHHLLQNCVNSGCGAAQLPGSHGSNSGRAWAVKCSSEKKITIDNLIVVHLETKYVKLAFNLYLINKSWSVLHQMMWYCLKPRCWL